MANLSSGGVPAEDPVVFGAAEKQLCVSLAPGYGENSPVRKPQSDTGQHCSKCPPVIKTKRLISAQSSHRTIPKSATRTLMNTISEISNSSDQHRCHSYTSNFKITPQYVSKCNTGIPLEKHNWKLTHYLVWSVYFLHCLVLNNFQLYHMMIVIV